MSRRDSKFLSTAALAAALALAGCGWGSDESELASLDNEIVGNDADPALTSALEDQILVDPSLSQQSGRNAVRPPDMPLQAQYPLTPAEREAARTGRGLVRAPAPTKAAADDQFSSLRQDTAAQRGAACGAQFNYDRSWAGRLPSTFAPYPGARITEAAGNDIGDCRMRVATFVTDAPSQRVLDWYHTKAIRAGYSSEHQVRDGDHILGGVNERDGGAFYLVVTARGAGSDVAIITNNGR